jgi:hypothetical protein
MRFYQQSDISNLFTIKQLALVIIQINLKSASQKMHICEINRTKPPLAQQLPDFTSKFTRLKCNFHEGTYYQIVEFGNTFTVQYS